MLGSVRWNWTVGASANSHNAWRRRMRKPRQEGLRPLSRRPGPQGRLVACRCKWTRETEKRDDAAPNLLTGILVDADGQAMTPTHAVKKGARYRYYVSRRLVTGKRGEERKGQTSARRIPAASVEGLVVQRLRSFFTIRSP